MVAGQLFEVDRLAAVDRVLDEPSRRAGVRPGRGVLGERFGVGNPLRQPVLTSTISPGRGVLWWRAIARGSSRGHRVGLRQRVDPGVGEDIEQDPA